MLQPVMGAVTPSNPHLNVPFSEMGRNNQSGTSGYEQTLDSLTDQVVAAHQAVKEKYGDKPRWDLIDLPEKKDQGVNYVRGEWKNGVGRRSQQRKKAMFQGSQDVNLQSSSKTKGEGGKALSSKTSGGLQKQYHLEKISQLEDKKTGFEFVAYSDGVVSRLTCEGAADDAEMICEEQHEPIAQTTKPTPTVPSESGPEENCDRLRVFSSSMFVALFVWCGVIYVCADIPRLVRRGFLNRSKNLPASTRLP